jgi:hypothetical protein
LSGRSCHSGLTSSGLVDVFARAREASLPAKTAHSHATLLERDRRLGRGREVWGRRTVVCAAWLVGFVACYVVDDALWVGQGGELLGVERREGEEGTP